VQVDPIKPTLKAPVTMRLKLKYVTSLSSFAFKFNLRRYNTADLAEAAAVLVVGGAVNSTAGRCRLTLSNARSTRLHFSA